MSEWISFCLKLFGFILSAVTTVFTVLLWSSLPEDIWSSILMGIAGFALEGSKFLLLVLALVFVRKKLYSASIVSAFLAILLFIVSIGASIGFLEKSEQQQQRSSDSWANTQKSVSQIDTDIETLLVSAKNDIENGYRTRGLDTRKDIAALREQRQTLLNVPDSMAAETSFGGLSSMIGMTDKSVRLFAWTLLAVLIDGVAAACWVFLGLLEEPETVLKPSEIQNSCTESVSKTGLRQSKIKSISEPYAKQPEPLLKVSELLKDDFNDTGTVLNCSSTASVIMEKQDELFENNSLFDQVKDKIELGQTGYDKHMSLNNLMKLESIGYGKARKVMDRIQKEYGLI